MTSLEFSFGRNVQRKANSRSSLVSGFGFTGVVDGRGVLLSLGLNGYVARILSSVESTGFEMSSEA